MSCMRMADGAARERPVVLEEEHGFVTAAREQVLPHAQAEADERVHVLFRVVGHIAVAGAALDEDELVGSLNDVVFIAQEDHVAFGGKDVRELAAVTEGAGIFLMTDGFWFLAS